jgi:hypothetical protein
MEARLHHPRAEGAQGPGLNANGQACFSAKPSNTFFTDFEIGAPLVILITTAAKRPFAFDGKRSRVMWTWLPPPSNASMAADTSVPR